MPSDDEIEVVKLKGRVKDQLTKVIQNEQDQFRLMKELADRMIRTASEKKVLSDMQQKLIDLEQIAVRNPSSRITTDELDSLKKSTSNLINSQENQRNLADSFLDLAGVFKEFLKKKEEYGKHLQELVGYQTKWQDLVYQYMKNKNKFVDDSKLRKSEEQIQDLDNKLNREQSQADRKIESLIEDAKSLDQAWINVQRAITKYGW
jgi:hypothetical protein